MQYFTERDLRGWKVEIKLAENALEEFRKQCKDNVAKFRRPNTDTSTDMENITPSKWSEPAMVTRFVRSKLSKLYLQEPEFTLNPEQQMYVGADGQGRNPDDDARVLAAGLNHFYRVTNQAEEDKKVIVECLLSGIGLKLHGYHTSFVYGPRLDETQWEFGYAIGSAKHYHAVAIGPDGKGKSSTDEKHSHRVTNGVIQDSKGHVHEFEPAADTEARAIIISLFRNMEFGDAPWEYDQFISKQSPWGKHLPTNRALWDPRGTQPSEWSYFAFWEYRQLADVKKFPLFKNTADLHAGGYYLATDSGAIETLEGQQPTNMPGDIDYDVDTFNSDYLRHIKIYTVYIKRDIVTQTRRAERNDKILVFAEGHDDPLFYGDNPYAVDGYPLAVCKWLPDPGKFTTISDVTAWQDLFDDYCHFRRVGLEKVDKNKRLYAILEPKDQKKSVAEKFAGAVDNECIPITSPVSDDIKKIVQLFPEAPIPAEIWNQEDRIRQEIREISGESETQQGQPLSTRTTATEVMKFSTAAEQLLGMEQASVLKFIKRSGEIFVSHLAQFYTGRTMVEIVNSLGDVQRLPFTEREARTRCRLDVVPESTVPMDRQFRRWELKDLMTTIASIPPLAQMLGQPGWMEFMKLLMETYRLPSIGKILSPPDVSMFAQMQQGAAGTEGQNMIGAGSSEAGPLAGQIEPRTQGALSAAPAQGQISGQAGRIF
jgi:hypothetical protein